MALAGPAHHGKANGTTRLVGGLRTAVSAKQTPTLTATRGLTACCPKSTCRKRCARSARPGNFQFMHGDLRTLHMPGRTAHSSRSRGGVTERKRGLERKSLSNFQAAATAGEAGGSLRERDTFCIRGRQRRQAHLQRELDAVRSGWSTTEAGLAARHGRPHARADVHKILYPVPAPSAAELGRSPSLPGREGWSVFHSPELKGSNSFSWSWRKPCCARRTTP